MSEKARRAFDEWKAADELSRVAEARLKAAWEQHHNGSGPPPSADLMTEISRLRALASDKLTVAMIHIGRK